MKQAIRLSILGLFLCLLATPAAAYLDPGTGSIILQGALAAIAGALVVLKLYWARTKYFFSAMFSSKSPTTADAENIDASENKKTDAES